MPMNTSVRWMHSGMQGAPVIDNNWGDLTAMLRACCVTGFNVRPIQSITCQGTKATIQCAGHGYVEHQVVQIENATPAGYNGTHRVVSVEGANTLTIELEAELPEAQAASGQTLQMRAAPLGFESLFDDGGQKLVLRSSDPRSTKNVLRVDDSCPPGYNTNWAKFGRVTMAQGMTDLDTFMGARAPFDPADPTKNEAPAGEGLNMRAGWFRWYYAMFGSDGISRMYEAREAERGRRQWVVVGDSRCFYFFSQIFTGNISLASWFFGDIESLQKPDAFASALFAAEHTASVNSYVAFQTDGGHVAGRKEFGGHLLLRDYWGEGGPVGCVPRTLDVSLGRSFASGSGELVFPNGPGNGLLMHPAWLLQKNGHIRGKMPGIYHLLHRHLLSNLTVVDGVSGLDGRKALIVNSSTDTGEGGSVAFDITGPWS